MRERSTVDLVDVLFKLRLRASIIVVDLNLCVGD